MLVLATSSAACNGSAAPTPPPPSAAGLSERSAAVTTADAGGPKVVFLGDSISAGLHLAAEQAFPALLARKLRFQLVNAGVSGDTTAGGLRRVDWLLKQSHALVVVELGGNDGMRGQPIAGIEQNLREIIQKVRASGAKVLLLGMRIPSSYGPEYAAEFEALYPRLARELDIPFVPFFMEGVAGVPEQNLPDGIHPTASGHEKLAQALVAPLEKLIAQAGPTTEH
ncbi:MAG TPA: arylesterase [Polyangiales bacterium]|nr:arylesterase [Polyangiales bacterium]